MKHVILFFLLISTLLAEDKSSDYSFRFAHGYASENDLGEILQGDLGKHPRDLSVYAFDGGYLLKKEWLEFPLDVYLKAGLAYFDEDKFDDTMEVNIYIKLYWNIDFLDNRARFGFGEGVSYTAELLETEYFESKADKEKNAQFLNYLDISLDFDFGKLISYKPLYETYIGYAIKHRSGVFGLYSGVHGGSNYNTLYLEKNF